MRALAVAAFALAGCKGKAPAPAHDAGPPGIKVTTPPIPAIVELAPNPDGSHSVAELRFGNGRKLLGRQLTAVGHVVWIYDCAEVGSDAGACAPPHFLLGTKATDIDGLMVAAVSPDAPAFAVGDPVRVTGTFAREAPDGSRHGVGVLIYGSMERAP